MSDYLKHSGVIDMEWGVRNGPPYPLSRKISTGKRLIKQKHKDSRYMKSKEGFRKNLESAVKKSSGMKNYEKNIKDVYKKRNKDGTLNRNYAFAYNQKLAEVMNEYVSTVISQGKTRGYYSPSGMVLTFVAMRGNKIGVEVALRTENYDLSQIKRGLHSDGRMAYKKEKVDTIEED